MSELIDRQAALEKVRTMQTYKLFEDIILVDKAEVQTELMMLPTVQPEPCEDAVSREDVLNEIYDSIKKCERALASNVFNEKERFGIECEMKSLRYSLDVLENLPTVQPEVLACGNGELVAQPEPKKGCWIRRGCGLDVECKCSVCGYKDFVEPHDTYWFKRNYCPNCGAKMRGE